MGEGMRCNGSHGLSPDGSLLAVSCSSPTVPGSHVYVLPAAGGVPRLVTQHTDSYFHTWSPDGKTIVFTRPDHAALNLFAISVEGGQERPLTTGTGVSDDPDFSPDGQYLYFCSDRAGSMQIWRMHPDGTLPEQVTSDDQVNWTPHPSPDGRWIVFLSYAPGTQGHPPNQPVTLRLMSVKEHTVTPLVHLTGGAGTINVPSWAPDSRHLAYVSYQVLP
jgi:Tol biopolymer transport system component